MNKNSNLNLAMILADEKGYKVINGRVFYKNKEVKLRLKKTGYYSFAIRINVSKINDVLVHRLVAYKKYGKDVFEKIVRHKDGNSKNNLEDNILLGTQSDNMMDIPEKIRHEKAVYASSFTKTHNHNEIIKFHKSGASYKKIMEKFNIKSKGTISFIINKSIKCKMSDGVTGNTSDFGPEDSRFEP